MVVYLCPIKKFTERFSSKVPDNTESGYPIGMFFLVSAEKIVTIVVNLNLYFVFGRSGVHCFMISNFFLHCNQIGFVHEKCDFSSRVLFLCA